MCVVLVAACGDDAEDASDSCAGDASVGRGCGDAAAGSGDAGDDGGSAGRGGGGASAGRGGSPGGGAGGSEAPDDDAGAEPEPDAGMPGAEPPMDGAQLGACNDDEDCTDGRECYEPGAQEAIGYCTETCGGDEDCEALGDAYTCNARMGMGMSMGVCRIECEGEGDTSCPDMMMCLETSPGSFRCAYVEDTDEPGEQNTQLWQPCERNGDCVEGLICYGAVAGGPAGESIGGFCTQPCEDSDECTEAAPSGDIEPSCGSSGGCRFECSEGDSCPDGMACEMVAGTSRCLYSNE
jgi:hypothetical protein